MSEIQYQVCLFKGKRICLRIRPLFEHFIADAPDEDGGMVAVAEYQVGQIAFVPVVEVTGIVMGCFSFPPHIECLVHHDEAHTVAKVEQFRCGRVMGTTDAVTAHFFQYLQLAFDGTEVDGCAQTSQVVVHTDTVYLHLFSVQDESFLCIETKSTDADRGIIDIKYFTGLFLFDNASYFIYIRVIKTPKVRIIQDHLLLHPIRNGRHHLNLRNSLSHHISVSINQPGLQNDIRQRNNFRIEHNIRAVGLPH